MTTMVIVSCGPRCWDGRGGGRASRLLEDDSLLLALESKGLKLSATTALGITETINGSKDARRTVFSLLGGSQTQLRYSHLRGVPGVANANDVINIA